MCGIVAIAHRDLRAPVSEAALRGMARTLVHRGPEDEGVLAGCGGGLGFRRLSFMDIPGGQQPFTNEAGNVHVVGNGEIYNYPELRGELEALGHRFRSGSDIEAALHAYEQWGCDAFTHLRGMFALALYDERTHALVAARDRAGEKPLFYADTTDGLFLASEVKALLVRPEVSREFDLQALDQFLTYEYVIAPRTLFAQIRSLPAAHYLVYRDGKVRVERYWDVAEVPVREWAAADAATAVRTALATAVDRQMMSDVPLGVFLSGGIDSSAIAAFMADAAVRRGVTVTSFSMGFRDQSYNELPYAREIATRFGLTHVEDLVTADVASLFDPLVAHLDQPFADVSFFPTYLVSRLARQHVKGVLAGDGGDELFGGYDAYAAQALAARLSRLTPDAAWQLADRVAQLVPPAAQKKGALNKVKRFLAGITSNTADLGHYRWMTFMDPPSRRRLYSPAMLDAALGGDVHREVREAFGAYRSDDAMNRELYADLRVYLADDILVKVDRMSMATSLETRAPFLDTDLMELAFSMPGHLKVRGDQRKIVLKQALRGVLPESILLRRKEGFSIPMKNWLRRELQPLMRDLLSAERLTRRGLFQPTEVARLMQEHVDGRANHAHQLFSLMVFERWADALEAPVQMPGIVAAS
ncbi:Asparagine synthetase [glutamine-hydrolyzing] 1 [Luteitalea pratensis]|uniref:asparagine synthase (glutamine-hydrolyzing) n=1 Tax=Luteitalea pratensis TaxID=1855912 RepID=A0A143PQT6_LUTPR|nr:asparagine synthase (glutamine-hydrolyzing) [Luteitalea pratensis]AMY10174.1 Asparagine synthetase [glutamine-hydrolyzing] 1 [Luteitalea pratensis]